MLFIPCTVYISIIPISFSWDEMNPHKHTDSISRSINSWNFFILWPFLNQIVSDLYLKYFPAPATEFKRFPSMEIEIQSIIELIFNIFNSPIEPQWCDHNKVAEGEEKNYKRFDLQIIRNWTEWNCGTFRYTFSMSIFTSIAAGW